MRAGRVVLLVALANVGLAACLFPSFDDFHEKATSGSGGTSAGSTSDGAGRSTSSTASTSSGNAGATGSGGNELPDAGGDRTDPHDPCFDGDSPVAVWPLDDGSGKTVRECIHGPTLSGTVSGNASWKAGRLSGKALAFDYENGAGMGAGNVALPDDEILRIGGDGSGGPKKFSVAAWWTSPDIRDDNVLNFLVSRKCWNFYITGNVRYDGGGTAYGFQAGVRFSNQEDVHPVEGFRYDAWTHSAMTYDGNKTLTFYVNGVVSDVETFEAPTTFSPTDDVMNLGSGGMNDLGFTGTLSEVRIYDRELTAKEVAVLATP